MAVARSFSHPYLTPLVGRDAEVELVLQQLTEETTRLLTLVGPGGVGKTRLALEVMDRLAGQFRAGTLLVDLAPISDPRLVLSTIAHAVGLGDSSPRPLLPRLQEYLTDREVLLVLDNFEHLLPATIQLPELLVAAPTAAHSSNEPGRPAAEPAADYPPLPSPGARFRHAPPAGAAGADPVGGALCGAGPGAAARLCPRRAHCFADRGACPAARWLAVGP